MRVCCWIQSQIFCDSFQDSILSYFVTFCIHNPIFRLRPQLRRDEAEVPRRQKKKFPLLLKKWKRRSQQPGEARNLLQPLKLNKLQRNLNLLLSSKLHFYNFDSDYNQTFSNNYFLQSPRTSSSQEGKWCHQGCHWRHEQLEQEEKETKVNKKLIICQYFYFFFTSQHSW